MELDSRYSSFDFMRNPTTPLSCSVMLQRENGGAESVLCAAVCELGYRLDVRHVTKGAIYRSLVGYVELLLRFY
jgi:hypothetical protein